MRRLACLGRDVDVRRGPGRLAPAASSRAAWPAAAAASARTPSLLAAAALLSPPGGRGLGAGGRRAAGCSRSTGSFRRAGSPWVTSSASASVSSRPCGSASSASAAARAARVQLVAQSWGRQPRLLQQLIGGGPVARLEHQSRRPDQEAAPLAAARGLGGAFERRRRLGASAPARARCARGRTTARGWRDPGPPPPRTRPAPAGVAPAGGGPAPARSGRGRSWDPSSARVRPGGPRSPASAPRRPPRRRPAGTPRRARTAAARGPAWTPASAPGWTRPASARRRPGCSRNTRGSSDVVGIVRLQDEQLAGGGLADDQLLRVQPGGRGAGVGDDQRARRLGAHAAQDDRLVEQVGAVERAQQLDQRMRAAAGGAGPRPMPGRPRWRAGPSRTRPAGSRASALRSSSKNSWPEREGREDKQTPRRRRPLVAGQGARQLDAPGAQRGWPAARTAPTRRSARCVPPADGSGRS